MNNYDGYNYMAFLRLAYLHWSCFYPFDNLNLIKLYLLLPVRLFWDQILNLQFKLTKHTNFWQKTMALLLIDVKITALHSYLSSDYLFFLLFFWAGWFLCPVAGALANLGDVDELSHGQPGKAKHQHQDQSKKIILKLVYQARTEHQKCWVNIR